ncbi:MAG: hypothetical protein J3Q66DRAFT_427158 [Benniella sp.]|nr:MAG: hypothetical protein J3Q66DRAFT_427158 [Benniella sp.]
MRPLQKTDGRGAGAVSPHQEMLSMRRSTYKVVEALTECPHKEILKAVEEILITSIGRALQSGKAEGGKLLLLLDLVDSSIKEMLTANPHDIGARDRCSEQLVSQNLFIWITRKDKRTFTPPGPSRECDPLTIIQAVQIVIQGQNPWDLQQNGLHQQIIKHLGRLLNGTTANTSLRADRLNKQYQPWTSFFFVHAQNLFIRKQKQNKEMFTPIGTSENMTPDRDGKYEIHAGPKTSPQPPSSQRQPGRPISRIIEKPQDTNGPPLRGQFSLILAYAMTVHWSESLTLYSVVVSVADTLCRSQAYFTLSRVHRFNPTVIFWIQRIERYKIEHSVEFATHMSGSQVLVVSFNIKDGSPFINRTLMEVCSRTLAFDTWRTTNREYSSSPEPFSKTIQAIAGFSAIRNPNNRFFA